MLGMCYITKQLRNRIRKLNLTCYTFYLGAFVTCGWDICSVFVSAAVIQQPHTTIIPACQGLPTNTGIIFSTLTLTFCPLLITAQDVSDNPEFLRACCRKDTTFVYASATFPLQPSQISAIEQLLLSVPRAIRLRGSAFLGKDFCLETLPLTCLLMHIFHELQRAT